MDPEYERRFLRMRSGNQMNTILSPNRLPEQSIGDRFIPCRNFTSWQNKFPLVLEPIATDPAKKSKNSTANFKDGTVYSLLLKNELLDTNFRNMNPGTENAGNVNSNLFSYHIQRLNEASSPFSPLSSSSQKLLSSSRKITLKRKIPAVPLKVFDARGLQDNFNLNLLDWSSTNLLSVGLANRVFLWNASTSKVACLGNLPSNGDTVASVAWKETGDILATGTHKGHVQLWDVATGNCKSIFIEHSARVGAMAWNGDVLTTGSRDKRILQKDVRTGNSFPDQHLIAHRQEICCLKWSPDKQYLASGGNDSQLLVWTMNSRLPVQNYKEHVAAVKAIAWSPHNHGLLASGGGVGDHCIRFWDTLTSQPKQCINTGSQVCNLAWSKYSSEFVSTHGISENNILVWKYPSLSNIAQLAAHSNRVLYLAMSPDGETIVTGAEDETLRFWNVFLKPIPPKKRPRSALNLCEVIR